MFCTYLRVYEGSVPCQHSGYVQKTYTLHSNERVLHWTNVWELRFKSYGLLTAAAVAIFFPISETVVCIATQKILHSRTERVHFDKYKWWNGREFYTRLSSRYEHSFFFPLHSWLFACFSSFKWIQIKGRIWILPTAGTHTHSFISSE